MPTLTDPEEDQQTSPDAPVQDEGQAVGTDRDSSLDQQGAAPLSASETSRLDQIAAGLQATGVFVGTHKKGFAIGGGIASLLIGAAFSFLSLLPLKVEAMVKNIMEKRVDNKIEYMMEKRTDKMVMGYLEKRFALSGTDANRVVTDSSLLASVYKTWRLNKFETKFSNASGINIEPVDGGGLRLTAPNGINETYKNAADFEKFLGENRGLDARKAIRTITRNETKWFQVLKRHNMRIFMRNAYGIKKWSWFTGKDDNAGATSEVDNALIDNAMDPYGNELGEVMHCALDGSECPKDNAGREQPYGTEPAAEVPKTAENGTGDATLEADSQGSLKTAIDKVKKLAPSEVASKGLEKILTTFLSDELASKIASKAVPIVGQILLIDQAARILHFFDSGQADKSLRAIHKIQYATAFAEFASIADNFKDPKKQMSGAEVNALLNKVGDISKTGDGKPSAAFNSLFLGTSGGKSIDPTLGVNDSANPIKDKYGTYLKATFPGLTAWYAAIDNTPLVHLVNAVNSVLGFLVGHFISLIGDIIPGLNSLMSDIGSLMSKALMWAITPAVDGTEFGGSLLNVLDVGGAVTGEDFSRALGGHVMSPAASTQLQQSIAAEQQQSAPGLMGRIFSTNYSSSVVNQLALATPSSPSAAMNSFATYSASLIQNPINWFSHLFGDWFTSKANADTPLVNYGLTDYGFTDQELDQPLQLPGDRNHDGTEDSTDCQYNADGSKMSDADFNDPNKGQICLLDVAAAQDLGVIVNGSQAVDNSDNGGLGGGGSAPSSSGGTGSIPTGDAQTLAQQVLNNPNISLLNADAKADVVAASQGQPSPITCTDGTADGATSTPLKSQLLGVLLALAQKYKIGVGYITNGCHTSGSYHYSGAAADVDIVNGTVISLPQSSMNTFAQDLVALLPQGGGIGQTPLCTVNNGTQTGLSINVPSGIRSFTDSCNHIHFEVPK